jgi:hypothetical protein
MQTLDKAKEAAVDATDTDGVEWFVGGRKVIVFPSGAREGLYYKYRIQLDGVMFLIHHNPPKGRQAIRLRYTADALIANPFQAIHTHSLEFLTTLGFTVQSDIPSRIDFQVMVDVPISAFQRFEQNNHCVSKLRNGGWRFKGLGAGKKYRGLTLGHINKVELCIYDKRKEMEHRGYAEKDVLLMNKAGMAWWNDTNRPITRVEFRVGREALRAFGVKRMADLFERERAIVNKLTWDWFRVLANPKVRGTENKAVVHPIWARIRSLFLLYFNGNAVKEVEWTKPEPIACEQTTLVKQGLGCFVRPLGMRYGKPQDEQTLLKQINDIASVHLSSVFAKVNAFVSKTEVLTGIRLGQEAYDDVEQALDVGVVEEVRRRVCAALG